MGGQEGLLAGWSTGRCTGLRAGRGGGRSSCSYLLPGCCPQEGFEEKPRFPGSHVVGLGNVASSSVDERLLTTLPQPSPHPACGLHPDPL